MRGRPSLKKRCRAAPLGPPALFFGYRPVPCDFFIKPSQNTYHSPHYVRPCSQGYRPAPRLTPLRYAYRVQTRRATPPASAPCRLHFARSGADFPHYVRGFGGVVWSGGYRPAVVPARPHDTTSQAPFRVQGENATGYAPRVFALHPPLRAPVLPPALPPPCADTGGSPAPLLPPRASVPRPCAGGARSSGYRAPSGYIITLVWSCPRCRASITLVGLGLSCPAGRLVSNARGWFAPYGRGAVLRGVLRAGTPAPRLWSLGGPRPSCSSPLPLVAPRHSGRGFGRAVSRYAGRFYRLPPCSVHGGWGLSPPRLHGGARSPLQSGRARRRASVGRLATRTTLLSFRPHSLHASAAFSRWSPAPPFHAARRARGSSYFIIGLPNRWAFRCGGPHAP